jgi:hypothetical protein
MSYYGDECQVFGFAGYAHRLFALFSVEYGFSTFLNGTCDESADTFPGLFGSLGDPLVCGAI